MAYSAGSTPIPPPPGGNRNTQHTVGGATSNFGYSAGKNLASARTLYQQGKAGTTFRNQAEARPQFNYQAKPGVAPVNAQAAGMQMRANTSGMVRNPNSTPGMGYGNLSNPMRQHVIYAQDGKEWGSYNMAPVHPAPAPPPTVVAPPAQANPNPAPPLKPPATGTGTTGIQNTILTNGGKGTEQIASPTNIQAVKTQDDRWSPPKDMKVGAAIPGMPGYTFAGRMQLSNGMYAPLVANKEHPNGAIHPSWQTWMKYSGITANTTRNIAQSVVNTAAKPVPKPAAPAPAPTAPAPVAPPPPAPVVTSPIGPAPPQSTPAPRYQNGMIYDMFNGQYLYRYNPTTRRNDTVNIGNLTQAEVLQLMARDINQRMFLAPSYYYDNGHIYRR